MKKAHFITPAIAAFFLATSCASDKEQIETPSDNTNLEGYSLIWQDEFNENEIDAANWNFETGDGTDYGLPVGWGNDEEQRYTDAPENARIQKEGQPIRFGDQRPQRRSGIHRLQIDHSKQI